MSFTPFVIVLAVMALLVGMLIVRHTMLGFNEDDSLHLPVGELGMEKEQIHRSHQLEAVERWSKILGIATAVYALALLATYAYTVLY